MCHSVVVAMALVASMASVVGTMVLFGVDN